MVVDLWSRQAILLIVNLLLAITLLPLTLLNSSQTLWLVYVVAAIQALLAQFTAPAAGALLPQVVSKAELPTANSLSSLNNNLARLIGSPLGGLVAAWFGLGGVVIGDAISFVVAAICAALLKLPAPEMTLAPQVEQPRPRLAVGGFWQEWLSGLKLVAQNYTLRVIFTLLAITAVGEGVLSVMFVIFIKEVLGGDSQAIGLVWGAQAIGGLIGGLIVGKLSQRLAPARLLGGCAIIFGILDLGLFNYPLILPSLIPALIIIGLVGLPSVGISVGILTLLQTSVEDNYRGRVLGAFGTTFALFSLLGTLLAGVVGNRANVVLLLNLQGGAYILAGGLALLLLGAS